jgi:DNA-binding CsgD family transcriptional regulator
MTSTTIVSRRKTMGRPNHRQATFGPQRALSLKSRLFVLLRDELGLGRQPKVAHLLVDEILAVIEDTFVGVDQLEPGQVLLLAPEIGQGPSWRLRKLEDKKLKALRLTLVADEDLDRLVAGERHVVVRLERMVRLIHQAYEQGATLTSAQLALLTGISPGRVSAQLRAYCRATGKTLPTRGVIEDCSPAITHKAEIVARHLAGESTAEIARATHHTPRSVERYLRRFEQVRELVGYLDRDPEPESIARILGCSERLVRTYLELLPGDEGRRRKREPA